MAKARSEFGDLLRQFRRRCGLTQEGLAKRIAAQAADDPARGVLGTFSEKAIANLEATKEQGERHVKPHATSIGILAKALELDPKGHEHAAFVDAADRVNAARHEHDEEDISASVQVNATVDLVDPNAFAPPPVVVTEGREAELGRLQGRLDDAIGGRAQIAFVAGDAGIGKSFLIREVCRRAEQADDTLVVAWGECTTPRGLGDPYQPFKQMLALLTGDVAGARAQQLVTAENGRRLRRLAGHAAGAVVEHGPDLVGSFLPSRALASRAKAAGGGQAAWFPALQRLANNPTPNAGLTPDHLYDQFCRVMLRLAERGPVVLVLDDLHWADDGACALLFSFARRLREVRSVPILIIGAYRLADLMSPPDDARHPLAPVVHEVRRYWNNAVIDLTATVGNVKGRAFVDGLVDREPNRLGEDVRGVLFERTEGLPLFATELLRWLQTQEALVKDDAGRWTVARDLTFDDLPGKVDAVIAERIDRLEPDLWETLACASVQGQIFTAEVVAQVLEIDRHELAQRLDGELVRRQRLLIPGGAIATGKRQLHRYRFAHALFQDHLYSNLLPLERGSLHAVTASALEAAHGSDTPEIALDVARHYDQAGEEKKAATYYKRAADHSKGTFDSESAIRWYRRASDLASSFDDRALIAQCLTGVADALRSQGKASDAIAVAGQAVATADEAQDMSIKADSLTVLGLLYHDSGQEETSQRYLRQALAFFDQSENRAGQCIAEYLLSYSLYGQGDYGEAVHHAGNALAIARAIGNRREEAESLVAVAYYHVDLGNYEEAIRYYEEALICQRETGDQRGEAVSFLNIGLCHIELGQHDIARAPLEQALAIGHDIRTPRTQAFALNYLGHVYEGLERWSAARRSYASALQLRREVGQFALAIDSLAGLVRVALAEGDLPAARRGVEEVLAWFDQHGPDGVEYPVRVYLTCIRALETLGEAHRARDALREAHALLTERADSIIDPELRRSFMECVPFNRELMALWKATAAQQQPALSHAGG